MKNGDIYNPATLQKLDTITKRIVETKGVVPYQILSIAHPRMKSITTYGGAIQVREVFFPGVPKTQADADRAEGAGRGDADVPGRRAHARGLRAEAIRRRKAVRVTRAP